MEFNKSIMNKIKEELQQKAKKKKILNIIYNENRLQPDGIKNDSQHFKNAKKWARLCHLKKNLLSWHICLPTNYISIIIY